VHLGLALAFNALDVLCDHVILPLVGVRLRDSLVTSFGDEMFINVFSYMATAICGHALLYAAQSQTRRLRETELRAELARAQLRALEMQLRPHFLFNALNSVSALVRAKKDQAAVKMIAELGDLLRAILRGDGEHEATVHEEVELAMRYLRIEEARFGDRLEARVSVAPEARSARVPRLVLQPLVENAVRHGVESADGRAEIELGAEVDGDMVWLSVRDRGDGMGLDGVAQSPGLGIGLANTRARLERLYGGKQKLELSAAEGGGVLARVGVPYHVGPVVLAP
jgi:LytS/YehU family sensor histidine kinase